MSAGSLGHWGVDLSCAGCEGRGASGRAFDIFDQQRLLALALALAASMGRVQRRDTKTRGDSSMSSPSPNGELLPESF